MRLAIADPPTQAKPPAVVHLSAGQLLAAAAVLDARGLNRTLVDAFYRAAEEVRTQHPETPDQPQRKETRW